MKQLDIEKEFDKFIPYVGGCRIDEIVGKSPNFDNADYIFKEDGIVAELKCLQDNKLHDKKLNGKIIKCCKKWQSEGIDIHYSHDGWRGTISNLTQERSDEILKIYAKSIKKRILKANKQIKSTKKQLNLDNYSGILLLANDGNLAIDPEQMFHILSYSMKNSFSGINAVIFFTVNYPGRADFTNADTLIWANLNRPNTEPISNDFFDKLHIGWATHMERVLNMEVLSYRLGDERNMKRIVNRNKGT